MKTQRLYVDQINRHSVIGHRFTWMTREFFSPYLSILPDRDASNFLSATDVLYIMSFLCSRSDWINSNLSKPNRSNSCKKYKG